MRNSIQALIAFIMSVFFRFGLMLVGGSAAMMAVSGCATQPTATVQHVAVAPADNLLVDCDIAEPPSKASYLGDTLIPPTADADLTTQLAYTKKLLARSQERERQLTELNLKQYQNADKCNKRFKGLRDWKADSLRALDATNKRE